MKLLRKKRVRLSECQHFSFYLKYIVLFAAICLFFIALMSYFNKSFVWRLDGIPLHGNNLLYSGRWIRNVLSNLFGGGNSIPLMNLQYGLGIDTHEALAIWYSDIFNLIGSLLVTEKNIEFVYAGIIVLRMFFSGVAFSVYGHYRKAAAWPLLLGSIAYAFNGYAFYLGMRHPYFMSAVIYFPLLLYSIEKIIQEKKYFAFGFWVFVSAAFSYYFLYMNMVFVFLYAVIRYFVLFRKEKITLLINIVSKTTLAFIMGVLMAAPFIFPRIYALSQSIRGEAFVATPSLLNYGDMHVLRFLYYLFLPSQKLGYWIELGVPALFAFCLIILLGNLRKKKIEAWVLTIVLIGVVMGLLIPAFGFALNGFTSVSNRWSYVFIFLVSWVIACYANDLLRLSKKKILYVMIVMTFFTAAYYLMSFDRKSMTAFGMLSFLGVGSAIRFINISKIRKKQKLCRLIISSTVVCSILGVCVLTFAERGMNYKSEFVERGMFMNNMRKTPASAVHELNDDSFFRISRSNAYISEANLSMIDQFYGVISTYGVRKKDFFDLNRNLENTGLFNTNVFYGFDNRPALNLLNNVKYLMRYENDRSPLPNSYQLFTTTQVQGENVNVYKSEYHVPLGYAYDSYSRVEKVEKLSPVDYQNSLLFNVALEDSDVNEILKNYPALTEGALPSPAKVYSNLQQNWQNVEKKADNLMFQKKGVLEIVVPEDTTGPSYLRLRDLQIQDKGFIIWNITVRGTLFTNQFTVLNPTNLYSYNQNNYTVYLGDSLHKGEKIKLTFPKEGNFRLSSVDLLIEEPDLFQSGAEKRSRYVLENINFDGNHIRGTFNAVNNQILLMAIPYSQGWTAKIDGEETPIMKANKVHAAIVIPAGTHSVEFSYFTPYLKESILISCMSFLIYGGFILYKKQAKPRTLKQQ